MEKNCTLPASPAPRAANSNQYQGWLQLKDFCKNESSVSQFRRELLTFAGKRLKTLQKGAPNGIYIERERWNVPEN